MFGGLFGFSRIMFREPLESARLEDNQDHLKDGLMRVCLRLVANSGSDRGMKVG